MVRYFKAAAVVTVVAAVTLGAAELLLRKMYGLGNPVLYQSHPLYGYRLKPHQRVGRQGGAVIAVNNLGLRADADWDSDPKGKVLFLGDSVTYGGSYISNGELFSALAVKGLAGVQSGNAGVNAWGVDNIHGLIVGTEFLPAEVYVSVVPEGDFYRGVTRIPGLPYWCRKPKGALHEALFFFLNQVNLGRYRSWEDDRSGDPERVVGEAAANLEETDRFIRAHGYRHLIYVTPSRNQVAGNTPKDARVFEALRKRSLAVVYLGDRLRERKLSAAAAKGLFHDPIHLSAEGHRLWGEMIGADLRRLMADSSAGQP